MAKKSEYSFSKRTRAEQIALCSDCNGNPTPCPFHLQNMKGTYCEKCMIVIDWEKIGEPTKVKKKVITQLSTEFPKQGDIMNARVIGVKVEEFIPNEPIDFNDLVYGDN
jgi:hypothetical protein